MEYSFARYLLSKQTVDDRSLNRLVLEALRANLPTDRIRIIEVGAGMGNMLARLLSWGIIRRGEYVMEDAMADNLHFAADWLPRWASENGLQCETRGDAGLAVFGGDRDIQVTFRNEDLFEFIRTAPEPGDLLVANAFLDLLPMPQSMMPLLSLTSGLAWLTLNFDGLTSLEPVIDADLDEKIESLYHRTMDTRPSGGDSRSGRHLLGILRELGKEVIAVGSSDWIVRAEGADYPADEAYFLRFILHFFEESLKGNPELDPSTFDAWLRQRRGQIDRGELTYIAHQLDYLVKV